MTRDIRKLAIELLAGCTFGLTVSVAFAVGGFPVRPHTYDHWFWGCAACFVILWAVNAHILLNLAPPHPSKADAAA
jgi:hypothetical protein